MTLVIAEAGVNHNGSEELAFKLVDAALAAGADIVKFQTFKAKNLVTKEAKQADYQTTNTGKSESQLEMLQRLELSFESHIRLIKYCDEVGIEFLSTAFDSDSLVFLTKELGLTRLKIPSGDITNAPLILEHARTNCDLILSTGMATLAEIETALGVIAFGLLSNPTVKPSLEAFQNAYASNDGQTILKKKVTVLHCTSEYPAPVDEINLNAMVTLKNAFKLATGYSDHSAGIQIPIGAVAMGACVIEKHFTLDKNMEGPDHKASLDPAELESMVTSIRIIERAMGSGVKYPTMSEVKNKAVARKSLVASKDIAKGEKLTSDNVTSKRPGNGLSPIYFWEIEGKQTERSYNCGDIIV